MAHFKTMFDHNHIGAWDLGGQDRVVVIKSVKAGKVGHGEKASKKPILTVETGKGAERTMACNVTNAKTIAGMYGPDTKDWLGKRVTLYPTTANFGSEVHECIRVRQRVPNKDVATSEMADVDPAVREAKLQELADRGEARGE